MNRHTPLRKQNLNKTAAQCNQTDRCQPDHYNTRVSTPTITRICSRCVFFCSTRINHHEVLLACLMLEVELCWFVLLSARSCGPFRHISGAKPGMTCHQCVVMTYSEILVADSETTLMTRPSRTPRVARPLARTVSLKRALGSPATARSRLRRLSF